MIKRRHLHECSEKETTETGGRAVVTGAGVGTEESC